MKRNYVVTGASSGIGQATAALLRDQGHRVIGVSRRGEVALDLADPDQRIQMREKVQALLDGEQLHGIVACSGLADPVTQTVAVNYFGAMATLEQLAPLLADHDSAVVVVSSLASIAPNSPELVELCLAGDEQEALRLASTMQYQPGNPIYTSSKRALNRWVRRNAVTSQWAGRGIPLNIVAPGMTDTAMIRNYEQNPEGYARLKAASPQPLGGMAQSEDSAQAILFFLSVKRVTGQVLFVDSGSEVTMVSEKNWMF